MMPIITTPWIMEPGKLIPHSQGLYNNTYPKSNQVGLGGLGVMCLPKDPRFAGSNPAEVDGFFQDVKILSTSPQGGTLKSRV